MVHTYDSEFMTVTNEQLSISFDDQAGEICVHYKPGTEKALFDICDMDGRVIHTGAMDDHTRIPTRDLNRGAIYVIWVVDGDRVLNARFNLARLMN